MTRIFTLEDRVNCAKRITESAANVKDWRLTRNIDREAKKEAVKLMNGKGYIIATPAELKAMYPSLIRWTPGQDADEKKVWGFYLTSYNPHGRCRVTIAAV